MAAITLFVKVALVVIFDPFFSVWCSGQSVYFSSGERERERERKLVILTEMVLSLNCHFSAAHFNLIQSI